MDRLVKGRSGTRLLLRDRQRTAAGAHPQERVINSALGGHENCAIGSAEQRATQPLGRAATLQRAAPSVTATNLAFRPPCSQYGQLVKVRNATGLLLRNRQRTAAGAHPQERGINSALRVHENCAIVSAVQSATQSLGRAATLQRAAPSVMATNLAFGSPCSEYGQLVKVRNATRLLLRDRQRTAAGAHPQERAINSAVRVHENCAIVSAVQSATQSLGRAATLQRAAPSLTATNLAFGSPCSEYGQLVKVRGATRLLLRDRQRTAAGAHPQERAINSAVRVHENCAIVSAVQSATQSLGRAA